MDWIRLRPTPRSSWSAPRRPANDSVLLAVPCSELLRRNAIMGGYGASAGFFFLPQLGSRFITGWLCNGAGASVLIAGLFHSMHNAIVNPTGLVAVVGLPQFEVPVIMAGIVVLAGAIIAVATRGRLGLNGDHERHRRMDATTARSQDQPACLGDPANDRDHLGVFEDDRRLMHAHTCL